MKYNNAITAFAAFACAMLVGCSAEEEVTKSPLPADSVVRINASVGDMQTRAAYTNDNLKEFGLFIQGGNSDYYNVKVENISGTWAPKYQLLWKSPEQQRKVLAYAPYDESYNGDIEATMYRHDVSVGTDQTSADDKSDFIVFYNGSFVPQQNAPDGTLRITLKHMLSQLNISITFGTEFNSTAPLAADPISEIKVNGTTIKGTFTYMNYGYVTASTAASDIQTVKAAPTGAFTAAADKESNATTAYSCILLPQTVSAGTFSVDITADGKLYTWTSSADVNLEQCMSHQLDLKVGKDNVILLSSGITTTAWVDGGSSTLETE